MNYEEMLAAAEDKQSYHLLDELPNEYNGKDTLATGRIKDNYIYVLVHDGQLNSLNNGEPISAEYFFDQATYDQYVDPKTGNFDSKKLSEALQVKPYQSYDMMNGDGHGELPAVETAGFGGFSTSFELPSTVSYTQMAVMRRKSGA